MCTTSATIVKTTATKTTTVAHGKLLENKIKGEILSYSSTAHRVALREAETDFRSFVSTFSLQVIVWMTGSFAAGVDMFQADLDFTLGVPAWAESVADKATKLRKIQDCFMQCTLFERVKLIRGKTPVIQMVHKATGTEIDVTIDGDDAKRNTQLLSMYVQADSRFAKLCKAVKGWASEAGIEGAKQHRLNSFSVCMMLIQYLQVVGVLPNLQAMFPEMVGNFEVLNDNYKRKNFKRDLKKRGHDFQKNKDSIVALYLGFLDYYARFDFGSQWVSIRHGAPQTKEFDEEGLPLHGLLKNHQYLVVADPFRLEVPRNCAVSVPTSALVRRIQSGFRTAHASILKKKTLFTHYPSVWRQQLDSEGKSGDLRMTVWREEVKQAEISAAEDIPWGSGVGDWDWNEEQPKDPRDFWNLEMKPVVEYEKFEAWPEYTPPMFF